MCQVALYKSTEKKIFIYSSDSSDSSEKINHATSQQKIPQNLFFLFPLSTLEKSNLTHLTTDARFSGHRFVMFVMFF